MVHLRFRQPQHKTIKYRFKSIQKCESKLFHKTLIFEFQILQITCYFLKINTIPSAQNQMHRDINIDLTQISL